MQSYDPNISIGGTRSSVVESGTALQFLHAIRDGQWAQAVATIRAEYQRVLNEAGDHKQAKKAISDSKRMLPAAMFSGTFSRRANDALIDHSGLLCADLDELDVQRRDTIRAKHSDCPHIYAVFTSPSGHGLKIVFRVPADPEKHAGSFEAIRRELKRIADCDLDESCKDVARLCYASHDPDILINPAAKELNPSEVNEANAEAVLLGVPDAAVSPPTLVVTAPDPPPVNLEVRRQIMTAFVGEIKWTTETRGYCECPGNAEHSNKDGKKDCEAHLDGAPGLHCFHNSCGSVVNAFNRRIQNEIGKAERAEANKRPEPTRPTPWHEPVDGAGLLDTLAAEFKRFLVLPLHADVFLALWTLHSYCWDAGEYSPILAITSPVRSCGKSRVLDVLEKLVAQPFRTGNLSESVLFRVLETRKCTALIDEFDTIPVERRETIANVLKHGFHRSGRVHRVEGEGKREVVEFCVFGPKALCAIKLSTLDPATVSRCLNVRMQRKRQTVKVERLRRYNPLDVQRQCLRWAQDNKVRLADPLVEMPDVLGDRQQDILEPLFAIAAVAGGEWPERIQAAALGLCGEYGDGAQDAAISLLAAVRTYYQENNTDKVTSADLVTWLNARAESSFASWHNGKGIAQHDIRKHLAGFEISPSVIRLSPEKTGRGYAREWFAEAWSCYLTPEIGVENRNNVTSPVNIGENGDSGLSHDSTLLQSKTSTNPNKDGLCYDVTEKEAPEAPATVRRRKV